MTSAWRVAGVAALLAVGCTGGGGDDAAEVAVEPLGPGVVTVPDWFEDPEVLGVGRASDASPFTSGFDDPSIVVFEPEGGSGDPDERVVASVVNFSGGRFDILDGQRLSSAGRQAIRLRSEGFAVYGTCGTRPLYVDIGSGRLLAIASRGSSDEDVDAIAASLDVDEAGAITGAAPDGWLEAGRLAPGWRSAPGATAATRLDGSFQLELLARRVDPAEAVAFDALRCPDPRTDQRPPTSVPASVFEGQEARTVTTDEGPARVGVIAPDEVIGILGDRVLSFRITYQSEFPSDTALAGMLGRIVAVPDAEYDAVAARFDQARGDAAMADVNAAVTVLSDATVDGHRLAVAEAPEGGGLCSVVVRSADGRSVFDPRYTFTSGAAACLPDPPDPANPFNIGYGLGSYPFHALVEAPPPVASVRVLDASGEAHPGLLVTVAPDRNVGLLVPPGVSLANVSTDEHGVQQLTVDGGPITVQWLDAAGAVIAEHVIGAAA